MSDSHALLIVEDDELLANALQTKFADKGYSVTLCMGGADAIKELKDKQFAVIITDLHMPAPDGFSVIAAAKETINAKTPTFVLTNLGTDRFCAEALQLGVKECFVKSKISLSDVVEKINEAVSE